MWAMNKETIECVVCYCDFETRDDLPLLRCCKDCVQTASDLGETRCPQCGWDSESIVCDESAPMTVTNRRPDWEYGYLGGEHWVENWTCPECGTQFSFENSSV